MAADFQAAILGTIVTASVFSITLVSTGRHEERTRALTRLAQLKDIEKQAQANLTRLRHTEQTESQKQIVRTGSGALTACLGEQADVLREATRDRFATNVIRLNIFLAAVLIGLALTFLLSGSRALDADSLSLLAFIVTELIVVSLGALDLGSVTKSMRREVNQHPVTLTESADRLLAKALEPHDPPGSRGRKNLIDRALRDARAAVAGSGENYHAALAVFGIAEIFGLVEHVEHNESLADPRPSALLGRAITLAGEEPYTLGALAYCGWTGLADSSLADLDTAVQKLIEAIKLSGQPAQDELGVREQGRDPRPVDLDSMREAWSAAFYDSVLSEFAFHASMKENEYWVASMLLFDLAARLAPVTIQPIDEMADDLLTRLENDARETSPLLRWASAKMAADHLLKVAQPNSKLALRLQGHAAAIEALEKEWEDQREEKRKRRSERQTRSRVREPITGTDPATPLRS
jgi:hypothetical protein